MNSLKSYYEHTQYADPKVSADGILAIVRQTDGSPDLVVLADDLETDKPITPPDHGVVDYDWIDGRSLWAVTRADHTFRLLHITNVHERGRVTEVPLHTVLEVNDEVYKILPCPNSELLAVHVQNGFTISIQFYRYDDLSTVIYEESVQKHLKLVEWAPGGNSILIKQFDNTFDEKLLSVRPESGEKRKITDHSETARYATPTWGPAGETVYAVTDYRSERLFAGGIGTSDRTPIPVITHPTYNIEGVGIKSNGQVVYSINEEGVSTPYIGELTGPHSITDRRLQSLPSGVISQADIGPDANRVYVAIRTETVPSSILAYDVTTDSYERLRSASGPSSEFPNCHDERLSRCIRYESRDGREIPALFTQPPSGTVVKGAIVDVHGGPESQRRPEYRPYVRWLLDNGYAVLEPNFRGSIGYGRSFSTLDHGRGRLKAIDDVADGAEWLRSTQSFDHVIVSGHSYGGLLALANTYEHPMVFDGAISVCGIYDLEQFIHSVEPQNRKLRLAEYGRPSEYPDVYETLSPLRHATDVAIPTLVIHGADDKKVPPDGAERFVESIPEAEEQTEFLFIEGEGHVIKSIDGLAEKHAAIDRFLQAVLSTAPH